MTATLSDQDANAIRRYCKEAKGITFDDCHKIYILLDDEQVRLMKEWDYDPIFTKDEMDADEMTEQVMKWFTRSCFLRFISAVETDEKDPNAGFITVIPQGYNGDGEESWD